ncbi:MAG: toxin-activating lysine-acyltransferase [Hyphomicrobiaceae bacterium]|nr:toxin-activating lysine-acyltransferase [Hyphomicrobiaceae bacterium]
MSLNVRTLPDPWMALGIALHFVARREPFSRFPAGELVRTLAGQVHRGHYLLAFDTSSNPAKVVGYCGWALYDNAQADRLVTSSEPLPDGLASGGDVVWMLTAVVEDRAAFHELRRRTRTLYPGHRLMAIRHKAGGRRIVLDRPTVGAPAGRPDEGGGLLR